MTPGVQGQVPPSEMLQALRRHASGDWGELCDEDRQANDLALQNGARLLSAYHTKGGTKFWIITEWDRSATTVLLPEEYGVAPTIPLETADPASKWRWVDAARTLALSSLLALPGASASPSRSNRDLLRPDPAASACPTDLKPDANRPLIDAAKSFRSRTGLRTGMQDTESPE